jgi:hypothetical protein
MFIAGYRASDGNRNWVLRGGGAGDDAAYGVALGRQIQSFSDVFVTGSFQGVATIAGWGLGSAGSNDIFVAQFWSSGQSLGASSGGGPGDDRGCAVATDSAGNAYVVGSFSGNAVIAGHALSSGGGLDGFLAKYDSSRNGLWSRPVPSTLRAPTGAPLPFNDEATGVGTDRDGNVFIGGYFQGTAAFGTRTNTSASTNAPDVSAGRSKAAARSRTRVSASRRTSRATPVSPAISPGRRRSWATALRARAARISSRRCMTARGG